MVDEPGCKEQIDQLLISCVEEFHDQPSGRPAIFIRRHIVSFHLSEKTARRSKGASPLCATIAQFSMARPS
jgi:hypothetical protein